MKSATRKPLQPKNTFLPSVTGAPLKPKGLQCEPDKPGKENHPFPSLAEELSAFRSKLERLRVDREGTEEKLKERGRVLDFQMEELLHRGEVQKMLEIEVDRLFRLKEIHSYSAEPKTDTMEESEEDKRGQSPSSIQSQEMKRGTNM